MTPQTRFEIKYWITPAKAAELREWLPMHMEPDENGEGGEPVYPVHSLYLDSREWSVYFDTTDGAFSRFKIRARCYSFEPNADLFLEVKSRSGEAMWKTRFRCDREEGARVLNGEMPHTLYDPGLANFRTHVDGRRAYPRVWVTYRRYAYVGGNRSLVRVTFDDRIAAAPATADLSEPPRWYSLPRVKDVVVLELKYTGSYPAWVGTMIRRFGLVRGSMSKYAHSVELLRATRRIDWSGTGSGALRADPADRCQLPELRVASAGGR